MPIYDYKCNNCKKELEKLVKKSDEIVICECGYILTKIFPSDTFNFRLKGPGWATDGYSKGKHI